jgi:two-component system, chemotaxis family, protein-glutamate methylesterase/glutaminase
LETERPRAREIVVIGASAGGVEALKRVIGALPTDLEAAVFVVLHVSSIGTSVLPDILGRVSGLRVAHAQEGDDIERGRVYVAPPDRHLLLESGRVRVVGGPKQNGHRPAIDPLFRSAARSYGVKVVGVVLSGTLDDGATGLLAIKRAGGISIVQDPRDALFRTMPERAIEVVGPHHVLPAEEIAAVIAEAIETTPVYPHGHVRDHRDDPDVLEGDLDRDVRGTISAYSCPECSGSLWEITEGANVRYRCRVGHAYTEEALNAGQGAAVESALWSALRALEERLELTRRLVRRLERLDNVRSASRIRNRVQTDEAHAEILRRVLYEHEAVSGEDPFVADPTSSGRG